MTNASTPANAGDVQAAAAAVLRMIQGLHISRAVYVAAKLGVADLLADGSRSAAELAELTKTHAPSLYRVLRLLAALDVFREEPHGHFALTPLGERLRTDVPGSLRNWASLTDQIGRLRPFDRILDTVTSGEPGLKLEYGDTWIDFLSKHPTEAVNFQAGMSERTAAFAPSVATTYDFSQMRRVVDVGGGRGTLLAAVLAARLTWKGLFLTCPRAWSTRGRLCGRLASRTDARSKAATFSPRFRRAPTATSWRMCCTTGTTSAVWPSWHGVAKQWQQPERCW